MNLLDTNCVKDSWPRAFYFPNYVTEDEEESLLQFISSSPKPKWQHLSNRRLQMWGGTPTAKGMIAEPLPDWILPYTDKLVDLGAFTPASKPNHILINEYLPGQGIMPHEDGPYYHPVVTTISLGCYTFLDFFRPVPETENYSLENRYLFSLFLEPRSLVVLTEDMYKNCLHGIAPQCEDSVIVNHIANFDLLSKDTKDLLTKHESLGTKLERTDTRVSVTIRNVPKIIKLNSHLSSWFKPT